MDLRLTDEHAVKGVAVVIREFGQMQNSLLFQSKTFNAVGFALGRDVLSRRPGQPQAAQGVLDADFPGRNAAQKDTVRRVGVKA